MNAISGYDLVICAMWAQISMGPIKPHLFVTAIMSRFRFDPALVSCRQAGMRRG